VTAFPGWITAVLLRLGAPDTQGNVTFMSQWHLHEQSSCAFNPLNTTLKRFGGTNCVHVSGATYVQRYPDATAGTSATVATLQEPQYADILRALKSGDPFAVFYAQSVANDLRTWGSGTFATWYLNHLTAQPAPPPPTSSGATPPTPATRATTAWRHLLKAIDRDVPGELRESARIRARILHR